MHKLFERQLAKARTARGEIDLELLGALVSAAYEEHDRDRRRTDRSIELMIEELDRINAQLVYALEVVPEGIVLFDAEDRFVLWNKQYLEMIGLPEASLKAGVTTFESALRDGIARGRIPEAIGREDEWIKNRLARHLQERNTEEQQMAGGQWLRIEERRTTDGGSIGIRVEITELKQREESFRLLFESNPMPMFVASRATLEFLAVNDAVARTYGYSGEQLLKMKVTDLLDAEERDHFADAIATGGPAGGGTVEARHRTANGAALKVDLFWRHFTYRGTAAIISAVIDMTEHERARVAERKNAEVLSATVTSMAEAVLVVDRLGRVQLANPAAVELFGELPDSDYQEWSMDFERFEPDGCTPLPKDQAPIARALRGELVDDFELVLKRPRQPQALDIVVTGRPLRDAAGRISGAVMVYRDVTKARETERQLRHAQKMEALGLLTGGIAHDFNNLLTAIIGTNAIIGEDVADRPALMALVRTVDEAASRGATLTKQLLAFGRRQPLQPRGTDINILVEDTIAMLRPTLGAQIEVKRTLDADAWSALVDPTQLTTALLNLALNARDAMPNGGVLGIESRNATLAGEADSLGIAPGDYVTISVFDNGSGIPAEIRDRIFEPFFTTKETGKGSGLGLSMVYGFVKQSGGGISVESEAGKGTTVRIFLPRGPARLPVAEPVSHSAVVSGTERILVVEDDPLVRRTAVKQLESMGYVVMTAASGAEALSKIEAGFSFDLVFTDMIMPGLNGRELAEEVLRRSPDSSVLFTSGYNEIDLTSRFAEAPILAKPYSKSELAAAVRSALLKRSRTADAAA